MCCLNMFNGFLREKKHDVTSCPLTNSHQEPCMFLCDLVILKWWILQMWILMNPLIQFFLFIYSVVVCEEWKKKAWEKKFKPCLQPTYKHACLWNPTFLGGLWCTHLPNFNNASSKPIRQEAGSKWRGTKLHSTWLKIQQCKFKANPVHPHLPIPTHIDFYSFTHLVNHYTTWVWLLDCLLQRVRKIVAVEKALSDAIKQSINSVPLKHAEAFGVFGLNVKKLFFM